jgi:tetratricopeptide (TPR) repeat protein
MLRKLLEGLERRQDALRERLGTDPRPSQAAPEAVDEDDRRRWAMLIGHAQLLEDQEQLVEAEALLRQVLAQNPQHLEAKLNLGNVLLRMGHDEAAERLYLDAALSTEFGYPAHLNLGNLQLRAGRPEEALVHYRRAEALRPEALDPKLGAALALEQQGRLAEAEAVYRQALPAESEPGPLLFNLVQLLRDQGRLGEALDLLAPHLQRTGVPEGLQQLADELAAAVGVQPSR